MNSIWFVDAKTLKEAKKVAPEATKLVKVFGGYMAFATLTDYEIWKNQK